MKVVGLGNALVDVLLQLNNDKVLEEIGIAKGGMDMISEEQMVTIRQSQKGLEQSQAPGGSVCNTMRAIAMLGNPTGFIGKIGADSVGEYYEEALQKSGVTPYFIKTNGISGSCTVLISPDGERSMATFLGPAPTIKAEEIREDMLRPYQYLYIEGYLLVNEELVRKTMQKAKQLGMKVALDLSNFNIVNAFHPLLEEIIPQYVDILFSNESEAEAYTGLPAQEAVKELSKMVDVSLVTLGAKGALAGSHGEITAIPAIKSDVVDTTGAGDHFAAGFLYGQTMGASIRQSAEIGTLLSSHIIKVIGAQIPDDKWEQIKLKVKKILA